MPCKGRANDVVGRGFGRLESLASHTMVLTCVKQIEAPTSPTRMPPKADRSYFRRGALPFRADGATKGWAGRIPDTLVGRR